MLIVHHLNNSRSQRILWLLEELGVPYEIQRYERNKKTMLAPPELKAIHPLGKSPVITDGDLTIAESGAIIEYLVDKYGPQLKPRAGSKEAIRYSYWLHFAEGSAMNPLLFTLVFNKIETAPMPFFVKPIAMKISENVKAAFIDPNLKNIFSFIESELEKSEWFAGAEFSATDVQMSFPMEAGDLRSGLLGPKSKAWLEKIHARPAYKKALERGGEYSIL
jgi:glutathione S-transferase